MRHPCRVPTSRRRASTAPRCDQARSATTPSEAPAAAVERDETTSSSSNGANVVAGAPRTEPLPLSGSGRDGVRDAADPGNGNGNSKNGSTRLVKAADGGTLVMQMLRGQEDTDQPRRGERRSPSAAGGKTVSRLHAGQDQAAVMFTAAELQGGSAAAADAAVPVAAAKPAQPPPPEAVALPAAQVQPASELEQQAAGVAAALEPVAAASASGAGVDASADTGKAPPQPFSLVRKVALAGGMLHLVCLEGDRMLRIWLPPGARNKAWVSFLLRAGVG